MGAELPSEDDGSADPDARHHRHELGLRMKEGQEAQDPEARVEACHAHETLCRGEEVRVGEDGPFGMAGRTRRIQDLAGIRGPNLKGRRLDREAVQGAFEIPVDSEDVLKGGQAAPHLFDLPRAGGVRDDDGGLRVVEDERQLGRLQVWVHGPRKATGAHGTEIREEELRAVRDDHGDGLARDRLEFAEVVGHLVHAGGESPVRVRSAVLHIGQKTTVAVFVGSGLQQGDQGVPSDHAVTP